MIPFQIGTIYIGEILITLLLFWYLSLGFKVFAVMLVQVVICHVLLFVLAQITPPLFPLLGIFILAWIGQFVGHKIEGQKPSFFKDLQFLLIGPLWVIRGLFS